VVQKYDHGVSKDMTVFDRETIGPKLAEVLFMARRLATEVRNMDEEADKMLKHWGERLAIALDELEATLKRGEKQPEKDKY